MNDQTTTAPPSTLLEEFARIAREHGYQGPTSAVQVYKFWFVGRTVAELEQVLATVRDGPPPLLPDPPDRPELIAQLERWLKFAREIEPLLAEWRTRMP